MNEREPVAAEQTDLGKPIDDDFQGVTTFPKLTKAVGETRNSILSNSQEQGVKKNGADISNVEIPSSESETTRPQNRVEIIAQCPEDFPDILKQFEKGMLTYQVRDGHVISDDVPEQLVEICQRIIDSEKMQDGILRCWARRGGKAAKGLDGWHNDGETIYLYSNKFPTEIVLDPNGKFKTGQNGRILSDSPTPSEEDISRPPDGAVVKMSGDVLHRRPPEGIGLEDRFVFRIDPKSK